MIAASERADALGAPSEELVAIVMRASRLGFCMSRVATALRISARDLATIRQRIDSDHVDPRSGHQQPLIQIDTQINLRMGQANVRRWVPEILPLVCGDDDPLGVEDFATDHVALEYAPEAYETLQKKRDGTFKVLLQP